MITGIILSAGLSTRMSFPKPLLIYKNKTFLENIANTFLASNIDELFIVVGDITIYNEHYLDKIQNLSTQKA